MTFNNIIIDANIVISLVNKQDSSRNKVVQKLKKLESEHVRFFLNPLIVSEICTVVLLRSKNVSLAKKAYQLLTAPGSNYIIEKLDEELEQETYRIFTEQAKPKLSATDCSLIAQAKLHGINNIFTLDQTLQKELGKYGLRLLT
ncbi:MAG: type II toxin-antitoxin system VapC family toxin [Candidatus Pacebacteria bacterium]|nr:type II toxin-antitoxin system VapC family toxin [Candidatus Paceibacterota bacterium]